MSRPEERALLSWLAELGARGLEGVYMADAGPKGSWGRGAFAARNFEVGDVVFELPGRALLEVQSRVPQVTLAEALLQERRLGVESPFAPYISALPKQGKLPPEHPLMWPCDMKADNVLAGSALFARLAGDMRRQGEERVRELLRAGATDDEAEARWALAVVETRAFILHGRQGCEHWALAPLLDILNTFSLPAEGGACFNCQWEQRGENIVVVARETIAQGEELLHLYGAHSSAKLWATYGYVPYGMSDNPFEQASLQIDLGGILAEKSDATREACAGGLAALGVRSEALSGEEPVTLTLPDDAGVEGMMLRVARLAACDNVPEVREAIADPLGPESHPTLELEGRAHVLLEVWLADALDKSETAQEALEEDLDSAGPSSARLVETALRLLRRERELFEFELQVAAEFVDGAEALLGAEDADTLREFEEEYWSIGDASA